jgi:FkbM family methyltransferase
MCRVSSTFWSETKLARQFVFDQPHAMKAAEARLEPLRELLPFLKRKLGLETALDAGCGIGYFASFLLRQGLQVFAFDGRQGNVEEASKRNPDITFYKADIEDTSVLGLGCFDLVLCFGLLYHLENPFRAIRHLHDLTKGPLLLESICVPSGTTLLHLRDEPALEDQSLTAVSFYPSEPCLIKMCYRAGFGYVYRLTPLPGHPDFRSSFDRHQMRTMLVASKLPLSFPTLSYVPEPRDAIDPWAKHRFLARAVHVLRKPLREKIRSIRFLWLRLFHFPLPLRLRFGVWWLLRNDASSHAILAGSFENGECRFVEKVLRPGMVVLDIGAHHGYYTLLAARKVGTAGRVISFEPSIRERKALLLHLRLNRFENVVVESAALGSALGEAEFFVVEGTQTGCNSLRPPVVAEPVTTHRVAVETWDQYAEREAVAHVDFVKLDAEGGELEILRGSEGMLRQASRPVIMAEVQDIRTRPWGYDAREIIRYLEEREFLWHRVLPDGNLEAIPRQKNYDGNFVAVPEEKLQELRERIQVIPGAL